MVAKLITPDESPVLDVVEAEGPGYEIEYLSKEEAWAFFDAEARKTLGISGEEFLERWEAGDWQPVPDTREGWPIAELAMTIPFARYAKS